MAGYKVIFKREQDWSKEELPIPWAEGCPLTVEKMQVSRNIDTGEAYFQAKMKNISDREVLSYRAVFSCSFEEGIGEEKPFVKFDADMPAGESAEIKPIKLSRGDAREASLSITEVKTTEGVWESSGEITSFPHTDELRLGKDAEKERMQQLKESGCSVPPGVGKHQCEIHDSWWRCACGCVNVGYSRCRLCSLDPEIEKGLRDEDELVRQAHERKAEQERREKAEREERERKKADAEAERERAKAKARIFARKHKKGIIASAAACLIALVVGAFSYFSAPDESFAVYSDSDKSLVFYKGKSVPSEGSSFRGKECTSVYKDIETWDGSIPGWADDHADSVEKVSFAASVAPKSCRAWFVDMRNCDSFDLKKLDTSKVNNFAYMFAGCSDVEELDLSNFDTNSAVNFKEMFWCCKALKSIKGAESWDVSKGADFEEMFYKCSSLKLDCSHWDVSGVKGRSADAHSLFQYKASGISSPSWPASRSSTGGSSSSSSGSSGTSGYGGLGSSGTAAANPWK